MLKRILVFVLVLLSIVSCTFNKPPKNTETGEFEPYDSIDINDLVNNQENRKLRVALLLPLTGKSGKIGDIMLKSAEMSLFANEINNIVLMPFDTKGTDFGAVDAINSAIRSGIDVVIGPFSTQETEAVVDIANSHALMVLSMSDNTKMLTKKRPNLYLMGLTPQQEVDRLISYLIDSKNFYGFSTLLPQNVYGGQVSTMFTDVLRRKDAKIIKRDFYVSNDPKMFVKVNEILNSVAYRDEVYKKYEKDKAIAKAENLKMDIKFTYTEDDKIYADALLLPDSGIDINKIGGFYANYLGEHRPILIGTSKWLNNNLYSNDDFNGGIFVAPDPMQYQTYQNKYYEVYHSYPIRIGSFVYDAVTAVIESYAKAQEKENLKYALENYQGFEGVNGRFRFLKTGFVERKLAILKIQKEKYEVIDYDEDPFLKY